MRLIVRSIALVLLSCVAAASDIAGAAQRDAPVACVAAPVVVREHKTQKAPTAPPAQKASQEGASLSADAQVTVVVDRDCAHAAASTPGVATPASAPAASATPAEKPGPVTSSPSTLHAFAQRQASTWTWREAVYLCVALADAVLAGLAFILIYWTFTRLRYEGLYLRRHWGGFGGSSTGWTMSPGLASLLFGAALGCVAGVVALCLIESMAPPTGQQAPSGEGGTTVAANAASAASASRR
jgi:hypothetical protein